MLKSALNIAILVVFVLCLLTASISFGGVLLEYALPFYGLLGLAAFFWALKLLLCRSVSWVWSPMHVPVLLFAGYTVVRYATSPIEYESRIDLLHVGAYTLAYFLVASNLYRSRDRLVIVSALIALALAESIYALWQYRQQMDWVFWMERQVYHGRGSGSYFCPNHLAGFLEIALGVLIARLLTNRAPNATLQSFLLHKLYEVAAAVLIFWGLFSTLSRGGWIAMAVALLFLLAFAELGRALSSRLAIGIFAGLILLGAWAWSFPQLRTRVEQAVRIELDYVPGEGPIQVVSGLTGRYPMWQATRRIIRDHLWFGTGPGTWQWFHPKYREPVMQMHPQFAHNDVLHLASDYGLVGTALVLAFLILFYRHAWRLLRDSESHELRVFALGAATAVTAILVHSLSDFNLHMPANALWFVTLIALTASQGASDRDRRTELTGFQKYLLTGALLVVLSSVGWVSFRLCLSARYTVLADDANQRSEWAEVIQLSERALRYDARNPEPYAQIGDAYRMQSAAAYGPGEQPERRRLALLSVNAYRQSLALNSFQSNVMLRLASAYELAGDYESAARTYEESLKVDPLSAFNWLRIGMFYRRRGDIPRAVEALKFSHRLNNVEPIAETYLKQIEAEQTRKP